MNLKTHILQMTGYLPYPGSNRDSLWEPDFKSRPSELELPFGFADSLPTNIPQHMPPKPPHTRSWSRCKSQLSHRWGSRDPRVYHPVCVFAALHFFWASLVAQSVKKTICLQCRSPRFNSWVREIPWRKKWQPTPIFLPGKPHGQRSLAGYSPWGHKESDTTQWLNHRHSAQTLS